MVFTLRSPHKLPVSAAALASAILLCALPVCAAVASGSAFTRTSAVAAGGDKIFSVADYGALPGDGKDDASAFQAALNAAAAKKGTVVVPRGNYTFNSGTLTVPAGVTLQGPQAGANPINGQARLDILATKGKESAAFLTLKEGAKVSGLAFHYPAQLSSRPTAFGWTIRLAGANIRVENIYCKNAWQFLDIGSTSSPNHHVEHCNIWAYKTGVYVDKQSGAGTIKDIHIWPFDGSKNDWVRENATGFLLGSAKNETIDGCFTIRYHIGFRFINGGNYTLQTSGADCGPTGMLIEKVGSLKATSGQFMHRVEVKSTNTGRVELVGCNFRQWAAESIQWQLKAAGSGEVVVDSCTFGSWDSANAGHGAIVSDGAPLTVIACDFMQDKTAVQLTANVKKATVTECIMKGKVTIKNASAGTVKIEKNAAY